VERNQVSQMPHAHARTAMRGFYRAACLSSLLSSDENSVCPSVKHVNCDKTEEKSVQIFIPYERSFSLIF